MSRAAAVRGGTVRRGAGRASALRPVVTDPEPRPRRCRRLRRAEHYTRLGGNLTVFALPQ